MKVKRDIDLFHVNPGKTTDCRITSRFDSYSSSAQLSVEGQDSKTYFGEGRYHFGGIEKYLTALIEDSIPDSQKIEKSKPFVSSVEKGQPTNEEDAARFLKSEIEIN